VISEPNLDITAFIIIQMTLKNDYKIKRRAAEAARIVGFIQVSLS
jgi:hypothetical protein